MPDWLLLFDAGNVRLYTPIYYAWDFECKQLDALVALYGTRSNLFVLLTPSERALAKRSEPIGKMSR
jgi:hypothetical protein